MASLDSLGGSRRLASRQETLIWIRVRVVVRVTGVRVGVRVTGVRVVVRVVVRVMVRVRVQHLESST